MSRTVCGIAQLVGGSRQSRRGYVLSYDGGGFRLRLGQCGARLVFHRLPFVEESLSVLEDPTSSSLTISTTHHGDLAIVTVAGSIDLLTAQQLTDAVSTIAADDPAGLIIDLSEVEFLASVGMSILLAAKQAVGSHGRFAVVAGGATHTPLQVGGLGEFILICSALSDAITALS